MTGREEERQRQRDKDREREREKERERERARERERESLREREKESLRERVRERTRVIRVGLRRSLCHVGPGSHGESPGQVDPEARAAGVRHCDMYTDKLWQVAVRQVASCNNPCRVAGT